MNYKTDSLASELMEKDMILLIKNEKSKFLSLDQFKNDSITIKNSEKAPKFDYDFMCVKNFSTQKMYKFFPILRDLYRITSEIPAFDWKIVDETKKIENFNCQKAILNFSNRVWEAWFTTDIALQTGPSIFGGLPGLIIQMNDNKNNYIFNLAGIKKDENIDTDYLSSKFLDVSENQFKKLQLDYYNDPYREMKTGNVKVIWQDEKGNPFTPDYKELTKDEQDYIKKNNNTIELSEAVKYPK
jgi:GLPGLI family protein